MATERLAARHPRVPLCVRLNSVGITEGWSINISLTGMAIMAVVQPPARVPASGSKVEVSFTLPTGDEPLSTSGQIKWLNQHTAHGAEQTRVLLGISFLHMSDTAHRLLASYIATYRPKVAIAAADREQAGLCQLALDNDMELHFASTVEELFLLLGRINISVILVFGSSAHQADEIIDALAEQTASAHLLHGPAPAVVYSGTGTQSELLRLHNEDKILCSVTEQAPREIFSATRRAAEDFAARIEMQRMGHELQRTQRALRGPQSLVSDMGTERDDTVIASPAMEEAMDLVRKAACFNIPVLFTGETGTGKEVLARDLHALSDRAGTPFVAQDCGALTETLLDSELFGHVKGAFTGAITHHSGLFAVAEGGTIFLDEIENTTHTMQSKLLRVLETGEVRPVGGSTSRRIDVRVIAATNRDLRNEVAAGRFRADLFYRLERFPIHVPPLRTRQEDIIPLANHFLEMAAHELRVPPVVLTPAACAQLLRYQWPGNVRELRNAIERAVLLTTPKRHIEPASLPIVVRESREAPAKIDGQSLKALVKEYERSLIKRALSRHGGVLKRAASELRTHPVTLGRRAKQLGLRPNDTDNT